MYGFHVDKTTNPSHFELGLHPPLNSLNYSQPPKGSCKKKLTFSFRFIHACRAKHFCNEIANEKRMQNSSLTPLHLMQYSDEWIWKETPLVMIAYLWHWMQKSCCSNSMRTHSTDFHRNFWEMLSKSCNDWMLLHTEEWRLYNLNNCNPTDSSPYTAL